MRRLWVRIALAFVAVTLASVTVVAVLASVSAAAQFQSFTEQQRAINHGDLTAALEEYYQVNGGWSGVDGVFSTIARANQPVEAPFPQPTNEHQDPGAPPRRPRGQTTYILADANGTILVDTLLNNTGKQLPEQQRKAAETLTSSGVQIGFLIVNTSTQSLLLEAEQLFVSQLRRNLLLAALVAALIAVALGIWLSRAIAAPLANLSQSAKALSARKWDTRAQPAGAQEISEVATAFNDMAASLQQAEVNRRSLTADIAHELRTPLTVIQGNLRAMLDGVYTLDRSEVALVYDETRLLSRLVDDLRELALAESGQLNLKLAPHDTEGLIRATADQFSMAADSQGVKIDVQPGPASTVNVDPDRVGQILRNLVGNALRHTAAGGTITLTSETANGRVKISIHDSGEGIAPADIPFVFERFFRGDKSRARSSGGTGLGLAIARSLVEAMGGAIGVESAAGQGSAFWFTLPAQSEVNPTNNTNSHDGPTH